MFYPVYSPGREAVNAICEADYFSLLYSIPEQIKKALDEAGIEIPFPHQKVILFKGDE